LRVGGHEGLRDVGFAVEDRAEGDKDFGEWGVGF